MLFYYQFSLIVSAVLTFWLIARWGKAISVFISLSVITIPVINLSYLKLALCYTVSEALLCNGLIYILSFLMQFMFFLYVLSFCKIRIHPAIILGIFSVVFVWVYIVALSKYTVGFLYKTVYLYHVNGISYLKKTYTPMRIVYYLILLSLVATDVIVLLHAYRRKDVSRKNITFLFVMYAIIVGSFFAGRRYANEIDTMPLVHCFYLISFLTLAPRLVLYDIDLLLSSNVDKEGSIGLVTFDYSLSYLGSNKKAVFYLPEFSALYIDSTLPDTSDLFLKIKKQIKIFEKTHKADFYIEKNDGEVILKISVGYLFRGKKTCGYRLRITDATKEQKYLQLLTNYNTNLENDVTEKTFRLQQIMNQFLMGIAEMVQNRDNNTGEHIKRTSMVVKFITDEMKKDSSLNLPNSFYENLVKAAPMHDIGKIAVDDAILRKPSKFTAEEYEMMKTHAQKGAEIIHNIFTSIDEPDFAWISENVANYHHERYDGSGYPSGLVGKKIPLEARIMAIADVYDALVSIRCYKPAYSHEKAFEIIEEGMGKQFDPDLNKYFIACREKIEEYYKEKD